MTSPQFIDRAKQFYFRWKWWLLGGLLLILLCLLVLLWPQNPQSRVERALVEHHRASDKMGGKVKVEGLTYRLVNSNWPDSVRWKAAIRSCAILADQTIVLANLGDMTRSRLRQDSMESVCKKADEIALRIKANANSKKTLTKAEYILHVTTEREVFTDTVTTILNDSLRVVWPGR